MKRIIKLPLIPLTLFATLTCGCGGSAGPATVAVQGLVSLNGDLIETGSILFEPKDGKGAPVSAHIIQGSYSASVEPGAKIVRIRAPKVVGQELVYPGSEDSPMTDTIVELIPASFNRHSELERDIVADDTVDFALATKPSQARRR